MTLLEQRLQLADVCRVFFDEADDSCVCGVDVGNLEFFEVQPEGRLQVEVRDVYNNNDCFETLQVVDNNAPAVRAA